MPLQPAVQKIAFKIHEDKFDESTVVVKEDKQIVDHCKSKEVNLPAAITNLHRPPLAVIENKFDVYEENIEEHNEGSPMSLDKSGVMSPEPGKTAQMMMLDVDEYRDEIYLYLRQIEVSVLTLCSK